MFAIALEDTNLVRVVLERAVVTVVTNSVSIGVPLVHIVHVRAVVFLIQYTCRSAPAITSVTNWPACGNPSQSY